jgi:hypothetical protein
MTLRAEALQSAIVRGEAVSADEVIRLTSEARRTLQPILSKAGRNRPGATPDLEEYLRSRRDVRVWHISDAMSGLSPQSVE